MDFRKSFKKIFGEIPIRIAGKIPKENYKICGKPLEEIAEGICSMGSEGIL